MRSGAPAAWVPRVEWPPRPRASCFRAPREGNWGASRGLPPDSKHGNPSVVRIRYRPGNARAALGLLCAWCLQACSRSQHAAFVPFVVGGRGAPALGCGWFVGRRRGCRHPGGGGGRSSGPPPGRGSGRLPWAGVKVTWAGGAAGAAGSRLGVGLMMTGACSLPVGAGR